MPLVVIERELEEPAEFSELQARERAVASSFETHQVRALRTYFGRDKRHMLCTYEARDVESVRQTQRVAELPITRAWAATELFLKDELPRGYSRVIVQRTLDEGLTFEMLKQRLSNPHGCNGRLGVKHVGVYASPDFRRICCCYHSPDLESVRIANREEEAPFDNLWVAELIEAAV